MKKQMAVFRIEDQYPERRYHTKNCPQCERTYYSIRSDRKTCSDTCRTYYNKNKDKPKKQTTISRVVKTDPRKKMISETNDILWKNRELLSVNIANELLVKDLERIGFQLNFVTYFQEDPILKKTTRFYCYDHYYIFTKKNPMTIKIFKSK